MKISTTGLVLLSMISGVVSESFNVPIESNNDIPFYLKLSDTNPDSVIAVIYYGELGDESKEIDVPCTMKGSSTSNDKYVGPESVTCQCEAIRRGCSGWGSSSSHTKVINNSKCQLQVPFQFEHDANGTITSVTFIKDNTNSTSDDTLIVPFYPKKDRDGNIIAVEVSANESAQQSSSSTTEAAISLLLLFIIIVGSIILLVSLVRIVQNLIRRGATKETIATSSVGINPMNVKNMADLENPQPHRRSTNMNRTHQDDDTATDDSASDN